jgi:hypothetical protein
MPYGTEVGNNAADQNSLQGAGQLQGTGTGQNTGTGQAASPNIVGNANSANAANNSSADNVDAGKDLTGDNQNNPSETNADDFVDFNAKEFKDIGLDKFLAGEKINKSVLEKLSEYEEHMAGGDLFQEKLHEALGDKAEAEFKYFTENSRKFINSEYNGRLDSLPADTKIMFLNIMNAASRSVDAVKKEYGVTGQSRVQTSASPADSRREFDSLTQRIIKGDYKNAEEFEALKKQRLAASLGLRPNNANINNNQ